MKAAHTSLFEVAPTLEQLRKLPAKQKDRILLARLAEIGRNNGDALNKHNLTLPGDSYALAQGYPDQLRMPVIEHLLGAPWTRLVNEGFLVDLSGQGFHRISAEGKDYLDFEPPISKVSAKPSDSELAARPTADAQLKASGAVGIRATRQPLEPPPTGMLDLSANQDSARLTLRMPTYKQFLLLALLCIPTLTLAEATQVCTATDADKPAVAKTVENIFAAAQVDSTSAFDALVTPGFYMFDGGKRFEGHAIIDLIIDQHKKGYKYVWTVPDPDIEIGCNTAWIAYQNVGSVTLPDGSRKDMKWLESAVLVKQGGKKNGQWRVRFFHSTRAE